MSSFSKKVLVEQAELDRMQQRQLKDYSPELHSLARLRTQIAETLARKDLAAEQKLQILNSYQSRFDKLQRDTGVATSGPLPKAEVTAISVPAPPTKKKKNAAIIPSTAGASYSADNQNNDNDNDDDEEDEEGERESMTPARKLIRDLRIDPMFENKARNLLAKILEHDDVLRRNASGELVVNGEVEPNSNFNTLVRSMVGRVHDLEQPGIDKFLNALRQIGVRKDELSGQKLQRLYAHAPLRDRTSDRTPKPTKHRPDYVYDEPPFGMPHYPYSRQKKHGDSTSYKGNASASSSRASSKHHALEQEQEGYGFKGKMNLLPPGHKPNVLYVY